MPFEKRPKSQNFQTSRHFNLTCCKFVLIENTDLLVSLYPEFSFLLHMIAAIRRRGPQTAGFFTTRTGHLALCTQQLLTLPRKALSRKTRVKLSNLSVLVYLEAQFRGTHVCIQQDNYTQLLIYLQVKDRRLVLHPITF